MVFTEQQAAAAAKALGIDFSTTRYSLPDFLCGIRAFQMSYEKGVKKKSGKTEYKQLKFELEDFDEEQGIFSGYAAVFGNVDSYGDVIEPGAFTKTIAENADRIKILVLHNDCWLPIGLPLELREDAHGLYVKGKISDTTMGRDVKTLLRDKVLCEMSIGYDPVTFDYDTEEAVRHLREIKLWEISLVTWAANPEALVTGYKATDVAGRAEQIAADIAAELKEGRKISTVRLKSLKDACTSMASAVKLLKAIISEADSGEKSAPPQGGRPPRKATTQHRKLPTAGSSATKTKPVIEITF